MPENQETPKDEPQDRETGYVDFPFTTYYSNAANVNSNFFDFNILFLDRYQAEATTIRARVVMTPTHAKLLAAALMDQVEKYEARWGEIRLPTLPTTPDSDSSSEPPPQS